MDDGEVEISDQVVLHNPNSSSNFHSSASADSYLDAYLKHTRTCTHTHTCNPSGPDAAQHTHTCYHTHTQVFGSEDDDHPNNKGHSSSKAKRPRGNREAVRKYREKKKAHTAYLEEEVRKLHLLNQQLVRKLQGQAILEAEVLRLRSLLLELKGKIDNEMGVSPYQKKQCNTTSVLKEGGCRVQHPVGEIGLSCQTDLQCFDPHAEPSSQIVSLEGNCQPMITDCRAEGNASDAVETLMSSASQAE